ncbi:hypothetical protein Taro_034979 [Colocasia esculenta]|uniref:Uncharacterized protein n=1 Tax=Colocasia esculenta TaxID=4460 RepID=A0A843W2F6_COLES|nr:hypothetical protein [Colocasia esculenta]
MNITREEAEASNLVVGMVPILGRATRVLIDPGATHCFASEEFFGLLTEFALEKTCDLALELPTDDYVRNAPSAMPHQTIHTPMGTSTFGCSSQDQGRVDSLKDSVDSLKSRVVSLKDSVDSLKSRVDSLKDSVDSLKSRVDSLKSRVDSLKSRVDSLWIF